MIFVTVGHQTPFDRLVRAVDEWAGAQGRDDVFAQIGRGSYRPQSMRFGAFLTPAEFRARMEEASAVVAHAGTGTLIACLELGKPLLMLPRQAGLGETRNDHQLATARRFSDRSSILVAWEESEMIPLLERLEQVPAAVPSDSSASPELIGRLRTFIHDG